MKIDLENFKPVNNQVLIQINSEMNDKLLLKNGNELYINCEFSPERHATVEGTVVKLPEKLSYNEHNNRESLDWLTTIEVEVGDQINYSWDSLILALDYKNNKHFIIDGKIYILINYRYIYALKRNNTIICINGYNLVGAVKIIDLPEELRPETLNKQIKAGLNIPRTVKDKLSDRWGRILYLGEPNKEYSEDVYSDDIEVSVGDLVMFSKFCNITLEFSIHKRFLGNTILYRIQRRFFETVFVPTI